MKVGVQCKRQETPGKRNASVYPVPLSPEVQQLRALGNDAMGAVLQAKFTVGPVDGPYEREADRVAEAVMRMPDRYAVPPAPSPSGGVGSEDVQRACMACEDGEDLPLQRAPLAAFITPVHTSVGTVQRENGGEVPSPDRVGPLPPLPPLAPMRLRLSPSTAQILGYASFEGFEIDVAEPTPELRARIERRAAALAQILDAAPPGSVFIVEGHADATGSEAHNEGLGQRRAEVVQDILVEAGLPVDRLQTRSAGERRLAVETQAADPRNRRVIVRLRAGMPRLGVNLDLDLTAPQPLGTLPQPSLEDLLPTPALTPEALAESNLERMLREGPPPSVPASPSLNDVLNNAINQAADDIADGLGIENEFLRGQLRGLIRSGVNKGISAGLDAGMDAMGLEGEAREAVETTIDALRQYRPGAPPGGSSGEGVQRSSAGTAPLSGGGPTPAGLTQRIDAVQGGSGQSLPESERQFFETRFGASFSTVRVHTGSLAHEAARILGARAFTVGHDVVFGAGQYRPGTRDGRHLLAHELTHVVQQRAVRPRVQRTIDDGHDLRSNRFKGNVELEQAYDDEIVIEDGDRGLHVTILQQALLDAGFSLPIHGVDGEFGSETEDAVEDFQIAKGLSGPDVDGRVGPTTMGLLDQHFLGHAPEHAIATDTTRALTEGTRTLSADEETAFTEAITTEVRTPSGGLPTFHRTIVTSPDPYEVRIENRLNQAITAMHAQLVSARPARTPANLLGGADIDRLAQKAKDVTDDVFGRYRTGPAMAYGVNILDQFDRRDSFIAASTANADWAANFRVRKLLNGDRGIKRIDREHGAVQSRPTEWSLIASVTGFPDPRPDFSTTTPHVTTGIVGNRRAELLDIHRNWPASAGGGDIYLQRYLGSTAAENRDLMYDLFATIIHEYVHTLEHANHEAYRESLPEQRGGFVLREGMTDYLAKMVWDNLTFDAALRTAIEGGFQDPLNPTGHSIPSPARYDEWRNAERAIGIAGIRNAMAAYFLGQTDLIGGP